MKSHEHLTVGGPWIHAWPTSRAGKLRPGGGGGGGGDGGASRMEADRQQRSREAIDQINSIFNAGDRDSMYNQQQEAVTTLNQNEVNRQQAAAERQNRFGLARAGISGGSVDIDSNEELARIQNEGLMKATGIGQGAAADLRTQDERTRQSLVGMAQSGIDASQAGQMALAGLSANNANAAGARSGATVGNLFGDLANAYLYNQQQQAFQAGYGPYRSTDKYGNVSTRDGADNGKII